MAKRSIARSPKFDPSIPRVTVEIDGEPFDLCFDFRALAAAKEKLRELDPPVEINILRSLDFHGLDVDTLPALLYAAAFRYQPDLSWERAQELVNLRTAGAVYAALAEAYMQALSVPVDAANPPQAAPTAT
jgi:hypothetical protein